LQATNYLHELREKTMIILNLPGKVRIQAVPSLFMMMICPIFLLYALLVRTGVKAKILMKFAIDVPMMRNSLTIPILCTVLKAEVITGVLFVLYFNKSVFKIM